MGLVAVESEQSAAAAARVEEYLGGKKEKKKKRRSNRRQKQNYPTHVQDRLHRESNVAFRSLPAIHTGDQLANSDSGSCPAPITYDGSVSLLGSANFISQQKCFDPHWSAEAVNDALQKGEVLQATFRVNAHNRMEAYCTIDGVPVDILISGISMQNRANGAVVKCEIIASISKRGFAYLWQLISAVDTHAT